MNREELINDALNSGNIELLDRVDKLSFDELENELASNNPVLELKKQIRLLTIRVEKLEGTDKPKIVLYKQLKDAIDKYGYDAEKVAKARGVTVKKTKTLLIELGIEPKGNEIELLKRLFKELE